MATATSHVIVLRNESCGTGLQFHDLCVTYVQLLPVELTEFSINYRSEPPILYWATASEQYNEKFGKNPEAIVACIGGGSNSMGMFYPFIEDREVQLIGVEAAGHGIDTEQHAASLTKGKPGVLHGALMYLLQDHAGQIQEAHSISAGLDYPGVGPEHSYLKDIGRVQYESITDDEALEALKLLCRLEGIIPALESAHAVAYAIKHAQKMTENESIVVCLSGRGDKDVQTIQANMKEAL